MKYLAVLVTLSVFFSCKKEEQPNVMLPNTISFTPETIQPPYPVDSSDSLIMDLNADGIDDLIWIVYSNSTNLGSSVRSTRVHGVNGTHIANDSSFTFNGPLMYQRRVLSLNNGTTIDPSLDYQSNQTMFVCFNHYDTIPFGPGNLWSDNTYVGDTIQIVGYSNTYGKFWVRSYNEFHSKVTVLNYGFSANQNFNVGDDPVIP